MREREIAIFKGIDAQAPGVQDVIRRGADGNLPVELELVNRQSCGIEMGRDGDVPFDAPVRPFVNSGESVPFPVAGVVSIVGGIFPSAVAGAGSSVAVTGSPVIRVGWGIAKCTAVMWREIKGL